MGNETPTQNSSVSPQQSLNQPTPSTWKAIFTWRMVTNFFLGISSGLPLMLTGPTLQAWMTDEKIDIKVIGLFSLVGLPYTIKFLWAPLLDRYLPPFLDRRRGWMLISQIALFLGIAAMSFISPASAPKMIVVFALIVAFFSASQDIAFDAYRREVLKDEELGLGSSLAVNGYRIGMLVSGGLALILADRMSWQMVYLILAATFIFFAIVTFISPEPPEKVIPPRSLKEAVVDPFIDYFRRKGAWEIVFFILLFKIGDVMAANLTTPFFLQTGFTKTEIGTIVKTFGLAATLLGLFLGGLIILKLKIRRSMWLFGILQALSTLGLAVLSEAGRSRELLTAVIAFENLASGMGTSAFVAFMASLTNKKFTATQYALLTSLMRVPGVFLAATTGYIQAATGWTNFFLLCTIAAVPGLLMLTRYKKWNDGRLE